MKLIVLLALIATALAQNNTNTNTGSCPNSDKHCARCNGNSCEICYDAFLTNTTITTTGGVLGVCNPYAGVNGTDDRWTYNGFTPRSNCNWGYYIDATGTCVPVLTPGTLIRGCQQENCDQCDQNGICTICARGYAVSNFNNTCVEFNVGDQSERCLRVDVNGACFQCRYGYFWTDGSCSPTYGTYRTSAKVIVSAFVALFAALF